LKALTVADGLRIGTPEGEGEEGTEPNPVPTPCCTELWIPSEDEDDELSDVRRNRSGIGMVEGIVGRGGGMRAEEPVLALWPIEGATVLRPDDGMINRSISAGLLLRGGDDAGVDADTDAEEEDLCNVGTKPSRSNDKNLDDRRDSSSSSWKLGTDRYVVERIKDPS